MRPIAYHQILHLSNELSSSFEQFAFEKCWSCLPWYDIKDSSADLAHNMQKKLLHEIAPSVGGFLLHDFLRISSKVCDSDMMFPVRFW